MALLPPKMTRIRATDDQQTHAGRGQDTAGNAIDKILQFLNFAFTLAGLTLTVNPLVSFVKAVTMSAGLTLGGVLTVPRGSAAAPPITSTNPTSGFFFLPAPAVTAGGTEVARFQGNLFTLFFGNVNAGTYSSLTGTWTAPIFNATTSVVSASGFKSIVGPFWVTGGTAVADAELSWGGATTTATLYSRFVAPFAGSIMGVSITGNTTVGAQNAIATVYKNAASTAATVTLGLTTGAASSGSATFAKAAVAFAANDVLEIRYRLSVGSAATVTASFIVEMGA